jgi:hypothetical protein
VSVSASAQKETHKQKPVFQAAVEVEDEALAAVLSVTPESSITCGSRRERRRKLTRRSQYSRPPRGRGRGPGCSTVNSLFLEDGSNQAVKVAAATSFNSINQSAQLSLSEEGSYGIETSLYLQSV